MKIIRKNEILSLTSTSSAASNPVTNLLSYQPKVKWTAASASVTSATITATVEGTTGGLGLVGVVADAVVVQITDPTGIVWENLSWWGDTGEGTILDPDTDLDPDTALIPAGVEDGSVEWYPSQAPDLVREYNWGETGEDFRNLWVSFEQFSGSVNITIELRKDATTPKTLAAGVLMIGDPIDVPGVQYPLEETLLDYSIEDTLLNGAQFYKRRDIVRVFSGTAVFERKKYFQEFMRDIVRLYGRTPMMVSLLDTQTNTDFVFYGRLSAMPTASHFSYDYSSLNFQFIEVF